MSEAMGVKCFLNSVTFALLKTWF